MEGDAAPKHPSDLKKGEVNPYIPKYISAVPWYQSGKNEGKQTEDDYLAHQRKNPEEVVNYSEAKAGEGIKDEFEQHGSFKVKKNEDFDSKRDRWYGYENDEWDKVLANWESLHRKKRKQEEAAQNYDSDDTDYELELVELNLSRKDLRKGIKEDPLEKTIRDRQDVPAYIQNITSNPANKVRIDYDPKSRLSKDLAKGFLNDQNQFVRKLSGEGLSMTEVQKFAWEEDKRDHKKQRTELLAKAFEEGNKDSEVNLDLSLEASPTLMMLKAKKNQEQKVEKLEQKKKALIDRYGGNDSPSEDFSQIREIDFAEEPKRSILDRNGLKRSRYTEDQLDLNHSYIYGSYYNDGKWGYKCCKQTSKNAYCTSQD